MVVQDIPLNPTLYILKYILKPFFTFRSKIVVVVQDERAETAWRRLACACVYRMNVCLSLCVICVCMYRESESVCVRERGREKESRDSVAPPSLCVRI